ncbi:MAG: hypothetical protein RL341_1470 [Pseudomonadota bacterium]
MLVDISKRKIVILPWAGFCSGLLPTAAQSQTLLGAMINSAGRNRMHSQRLARSYAQLVLNVEPESSRRYMRESFSAVALTLDSLEMAAPNATVREAVKLAMGVWSKYKAYLETTPSKSHLKNVNASAEEFFSASHALTNALQNVVNQKTAKLTNDAGAQRPRAMRLAKCYLLEFGGVALANEIRIAKTQFEEVHKSLEQAPETTGSIRAQLDLVKIQFGFIATAVDGVNLEREKFARAAVTTSERIVEIMDEVVRGYAVQVKSS